MSAFHASPAWRAARLAAKRRDGWKCRKCGSRVGLEVDHIAPRERRPDLALALDNLQTLCRGCHIGKTRSESVSRLPDEKKKWLDAVETLQRRRA